MSAELIKQIKALFGDRVHYRPYNVNDTKILYGVPPVPIKGLHYLMSRHNNPQTSLVMGLNGKGIFVPNQNKSGIIELAIMSGTVSCGGIQVMEFTGIPFPIMIADSQSGGTSTVVASACRRVGTPEWRRDKIPGVTIFTFETPQLLLSDGIRLAG